MTDHKNQVQVKPGVYIDADQIIKVKQVDESKVEVRYLSGRTSTIANCDAASVMAKVTEFKQSQKKS